MKQLFAIHDRVVEALLHLPGIIIAAMAIGISLDVLLRNFGISSVPWILEVVEYGLFVLTFAGTAAVLKHGRHVQVDLWGALVSPRTRALSDMSVAILMAAITALLLFYGVKAMLLAFDRNAMLRQYFDVPEWIVLLVLPIGWTLVLIECARKIVEARANMVAAR